MQLFLSSIRVQSPDAPRSVGPTSRTPRSGARAPREDRPAAVVSLSDEALQALSDEEARLAELAELQGRLPRVQREAEEERRALQEQQAILRGHELSESDQAHVQELRQIDREIRTHEASHLAAAGGLASSLQLQTVTGADGRQYAVGGSVKIDVSDAGSPEANEAKMRKVKAAALAVDTPSMADLRVAAKAERGLQKALQARAAQRYEEQARGR